VTASSFRIDINTGSAPVTQTVALSSGSLTLNLPAGPFVQVTALGTKLVVAGATLNGDFTFSKSATGAIQVGAANVWLDYTIDSSDSVNLTNGQGAFVAFPGASGGFAGTLSGTISAAVGTAFSAGGNLSVRVNTTPNPVDQTITVGGQKLAIQFSASEVATNGTPYFNVSAGSVSLNIGNFVTLEGSVSFTNANNQFAFGGTGLTLFLGRGPPQLANSFQSPNPSALGVLLNYATVGLVKVPGTGGAADRDMAAATVAAQIGRIDDARITSSPGRRR